MCGITGVIVFNKEKNSLKDKIDKAISTLNKRGPDFQAFKHLSTNTSCAHARLSIIDTSIDANQPMTNSSGQYTIVFNGEIYNYLDLKKDLEAKGIVFKTSSDTEVLLYLFIEYGKDCLKMVNGFYAFSVFDAKNKKTFIARDKIGIKPLIYRHTKDSFLYGSELKAIMAYGISKKIDFNSLQEYFQFNYIPNPNTILEGVKKLEPGHYIEICETGTFIKEKYYEIPKTTEYKIFDYSIAQSKLKQLLDKSVQDRMVSDVPLGTFLSGGIDSSVITSIASKYKTDLNTFSVGFKDNPYFDETKYAQLVANKYKTNHTVFSLSNNDLFENLHEILDYIDQPFADSSAIPVYILCNKTRKDVTVSLSGDGADEMFGGYNKHYAEWKVRQKNISNSIVSSLNPIWKRLPKSRNNKLGNLFRQLNRFSDGYNLSDAERYRKWCSFASEKYTARLIKKNVDKKELDIRKEKINNYFTLTGDLNESLYADMNHVLVNDMLIKVDSMSMANSLEVRTPFLDHHLVDFAFQLPPKFKVNKNGRKMILKDAYKEDLPSELYQRNKMGFELPLLQWFQTDLKSLILNDLLSEKFILNQNLFHWSEIQRLRQKLFSHNPEDVHAQIWALIVFQTWWKKNMNS